MCKKKSKLKWPKKREHGNFGQKSAFNSSNISKKKRTEKVLIIVQKLVPEKINKNICQKIVL